MQRATGERRRWRRRGVVRLGAAGALGATAAGRAGAQSLAAPPLLRLALPDAPSTLDPQRAVAPVDRAVVRQLWEPLFRFAAGPEPLPAGAEDARPDPDAAVWHFRLRPDLIWPDGTPLRAADFVRGWQRLMDREVPDEVFAPFRAVRAAGLVRTALAGPEALDFRAVAADAIEVGLDGPGAHFRHVAALWLGAPAPPPGGATGGNGPFLLLDRDAGRLRLAPNPAYREGPPAVAVDILTGSGAIGDALTDLAAAGGDARTALADVVPVPDDLTAAVLADPRLAALAVRQTRPATTWITCNVDRAPLDQPLLRRALAAAVDRDAYVATALGGAAIPAYSLLPPGCPGHDPDAGTAYRARSAAAAALGASGVDPAAVAALRLTVPATDAGRRAGTAVVDSIARHLGVRPGLAEIDRYAYVRALEQRRFDLAIGGWESPYPDPEGWFWLPFGEEKAENRTGWSSRPLDALWRRADAEVDPAARLALYGAAQQILLDEMPVIFLAHPQRVAIAHPRVAGLTASAMDEVTGTAALRDLRLDE